jgi:hypothetical protein
MKAPLFKLKYFFTLLKSAIILFVVCFLLYLPFSRQPDYFDSETAPAIIKLNLGILVAEYSEYGKYYSIKVDSIKYHNRIGDRVQVIYELREPAHASIYNPWGYWFIPVELAWSIGIFTVLLGVAYATTHRPHPNAIAEQLKVDDAPKKKYE